MMEIIQYFEKCTKCKRELLVSVALIGVNHNAGLSVTCKECLKKSGLDKEFKKQSPKESKEVEEWLKE